MSRAILPGSYDPVTVGHLDLIRRAAERYDEVYAVIFRNPEKTYRFSLDDRVKMLILATDDLPNVLVSYSDGLVIDYMRDSGIDTIVKGYRSEKDLAYEREQAAWNELHGGVKTVLLPASPMLSEVSSTAVRAVLDRIAESAPVSLPDDEKVSAPAVAAKGGANVSAPDDEKEDGANAASAVSLSAVQEADCEKSSLPAGAKERCEKISPPADEKEDGEAALRRLVPPAVADYLLRKSRQK